MDLDNLTSPLLMLVTEPHSALADVVAEAISGGVNMVMIRRKDAQASPSERQLADIRAAARGRAVVVANGLPPEIAAGLDGCHLPEFAEREAGEEGEGPVGRSVHSAAAARQAEQAGVRYVVAGTIFASRSHPGIAPQGITFLREVCRSVRIPVLAIGGITVRTAGDCVSAGAAGVAVLSSIMRSDNPRQAAEAFWTALESAR